MDPLTKNRDKTVRTEHECVVCNERRSQAEYVYRYSGKNSSIFRCMNCGHLFIQPVPLQLLDDRTMDTIADAEFEGSELLKKLQKHIVINKEIRKVRPYLNKTRPTLLDLGCGTGWTTAIWRDRGFQVTGLEPSAPRRAIAVQRHHLDVSDKHIEQFVAERKFDVVIMRHLLEHIESPAQVLAKVKSFLERDGILLVIIPNINCIGRYVFQENWEWILPWHLHFYTPKTLERLLTRCGFEKLKVYQMPSPLWYPHTINKALFGGNARFKFPHAVASVLSLPIVLLGALLNLNDNMTLIFRNRTPEF